MLRQKKTSALIIGSGLAGLSCALELARRGITVTVVSKSEDLYACNTAWAQGGIAYLDDTQSVGDSLELYAQDMIQSGDGMNHEPAVQQLTQLGNKLIKAEMIDQLKIPFDRDSRGILLKSKEGAHSRARVIHVGDATGKAIQTGLVKVATAHPNIEILSNYTAVDLLTTQHHCVGRTFTYSLDNVCCGAYLLDNTSGRVKTVPADYTLLATGGIGQLYLHSSNSPGSIGDGMVMAKRAGAAILFPHYIQFHPTALAKGRQRFLISEVVRGAGAQLLNGRGERFMKRYNPQQLELASRDELTRAIIQEMIANEEEFVYLDLSTHRQEEGPIEERFPTIFQECLKFGIDIRSQPIPVVPAAHYLCGGVKVDLNGRTTLERLFAAGEVACSGAHGANRLASTSLTECLTWGHQAAKTIADALERQEGLSDTIVNALRDWEDVGESVRLDRQRLAGDWSRMRTVMWNYVGIIRNPKLLEIASKDFRLLGESLAELYFNAAMSKDLVDLFHGIRACQLIVDSAKKDPVSVGCHYLSG